MSTKLNMASEHSEQLVFYLNGKKVVDPHVQPDLSLANYLRQVHRLTGTKIGCNEGGCGACTVLVSHFDHQKRRVVNRAVNACLAPVGSVDNCHVITVEGLGSARRGLHPIQARMAEFHGSQCGFCTPGIVMALYALLRNNPRPTMHEIEECFDGNLCRCTGYRPILDAAKTFAVDHPCQSSDCGSSSASSSSGCGLGSACCQQNIYEPTDAAVLAADAEAKKQLAEFKADSPSGDLTKRDLIRSCSCTKGCDYSPLTEEEVAASSELIFPPELALMKPRPLKLIGQRIVWYRPMTLLQLLRIKHLFPHAKFVQGNTEVGIETRFKAAHYPVQIGLTHVSDLMQFRVTDEGVHVGSALPLTQLDEAIQELVSKHGEAKCQNFLAIRQQLRWFASRQIRNVACLAGNIVTASPISDLNPVLQAAGARFSLASYEPRPHFPAPHALSAAEVKEAIVELKDEAAQAIRDAARRRRREARKAKEDGKKREESSSSDEDENESAAAASARKEAKRLAKQAQNKEEKQDSESDSESEEELAAVTAPTEHTILTPDNEEDLKSVVRRDVEARKFFLAYRKVDIQPDEVLTSVFIPFTSELSFSRAYKQARRRDDDISIVTSCFNIELTKVGDAQYNIKSAALSFGGVAAITRMAPLTEAYLAGKPFNAATFDGAYAELARDIDMPANAPGGQVEYRRSLCSSFLFKFFLQVSEALGLPLSSEERSGTVAMGTIPAQSLELNHSSSSASSSRAMVSHGAQEYQQTPNMLQPVGQSVVHASATLQVTGEAKYNDDIDVPPQTLHAVPVQSARPHARIVSIDASQALALPGVVAFISAKDIPAGGSNTMGEVIADEECFATKEVHCVGQVIGLLVAQSEVAAAQGARLVQVHYEDLPAVLSIDQAIEQGSFFPTVHTIRNGRASDAEIEASLKEASHVIEGEVRIGGQEHFYFETNSCLAIPGEFPGDMILHVSTQNPNSTQEWAAHALGVPASRVLCKVKRLGGGFGGKETRSITLSSAVAVAAAKLNMPVKCTLERNQDMIYSGHRHPFYARYRVGVMPNGRIHAVDMQIYNNGGWSHDLSIAVLDRALFHSDNVYNFSNMRVQGRICRTNLPSNTAFRGFGGPQGMMIAENIIDHVVRHLQLPAPEVRRLNMYRPAGDLTHFGQPIEPFNVPRMWNDLWSRSQVAERQAAIEQFNKENKYRKRGMCVLPTKFGCSFTAKFLNQGGALVLVYTDGSVLVSHGGTEMGQGLHTKMAQIAASAFEISLKEVFVAETATDKVANASPTAASMSSDINGAAVMDACQQILARLRPYREANPEATFKEIVKKAYFDRVNLCAQGFHAVPHTFGYDWNTGTGKPFAYFTTGVSVSEVEVDVLTGDHTIIRSDILMDIGASLNPGIDIGQIEGAFMQGVGWCTLEELIYGDRDHPWVRPGHLFTSGPGAYKIPSFNDVPLDFRVYLLKDAPNPNAIHSSKAVGEPPLFTAASVFFAIKDAIAAARADQGLVGAFPLASPATSERIRMAVADRFAKTFIEVNGGNSAQFVAKGSV